MTFLTVSPEILRGSNAGPEDLRHAQDVWADAIRRYQPGWDESPIGKLGDLFTADSQPAVEEMIALAWHLRQLHNNLTQKSVPVFAKKMDALFRERDERRFRELVAELDAGAQFANVVSPLAFEPYVAAGELPHEAVASPDYAIALPDGLVAIEVTVMYVEALQAWQRLVDTVSSMLRERLSSASAFRSIIFRVPLEITGTAAGDLVSRRIMGEIVATDRGRIERPTRAGVATIEWEPLPVLRGAEVSRSHEYPATLFTSDTQGPSPFASGLHFAFHPIFEPKRLEDLVFRSLRATLARKREQFVGKEEPYVLILQLGHHRIPADGVRFLLASRIWPNPKYSWVTAVGVHEPLRHHGSGTRRGSLTFNVNTSATPPASRDLLALLSGTATFHKP